MPPPPPPEPSGELGPCVIVVGMHRSGTSATTGALAELGLGLPVGSDLVGPSFGNEKGQFESASLMALSDELLGRLGRSWDDPPPLEEMSSGVPALLEPYLRRARATFEAAFGATSGAVVWKDPRSALLLPFWRAAIERPMAAVFVTRRPEEVARSLARRDGFSLTASVALWERYTRHVLAGIGGLPSFVSVFEESLSDSGRWQEAVRAWLTSLGIEARGNVRGFEPSQRHERVGSRATEHEEGGALVLPSQQRLARTVVSMAGAHDAFVPPALEPESPWTTAELQSRHELGRIWSTTEWLGRQLTEITTPRQETTTAAAPRYPMDATDDEERYHAWLRGRGEATSVGSSDGLVAAATRPGGTKSPLFSVVVPSYRPPLWALERCVNSVLIQDFAEWELIIVDDASGDTALRSNLERIASSDERISVSFRSENGGISAATNDGLALARGEFVVFLDHDDEIASGALKKLAGAISSTPNCQLVYSDEDKIDEEGRRFMPSFKPGWSPDLLLSNAYMCHLLVLRRSLVSEVGGLRSEFDGAQDYDLMLRATERLEAEQILHLPEILYHWRTIIGSASGDPAAKPWAFEAGRRAIASALARRGIEGEVFSHPRVPGSYNVHRRVQGRPLVSAVVPFRDEPALLAACYRAFTDDPGHEEFELLLVDNGSVLPETRAVMSELARDHRVRLLGAPGPFDWVAINNEAVERSRGDLLLFLNNDVEARSPHWLAHMVAQAQREDVGAVGARLLYPDGTVQHGGVAVGVCFGAAHLQQGIEGNRPGYLSGLSVTRNCSAVTGACMMSRREVFESVGGFDHSLPIAFNDIDYCLRLREKGLLIVYTPLAELVHHESKSRGHTDDAKELPYFRARWREVLFEGDPYYNQNLGRFDSFCRLPSEEDEDRWESFRSMLNMSSTS